MRLSQSIDIAASPERIWPFLTKPHEIVKWCFAFQKCEYSSKQRFGAGVSFRVKEKAGGALRNLELTTTEWVENASVALRVHCLFRSYQQRWTIEPTERGSRFTFSEDVETTHGVIGTLLGFFSRPTSGPRLKEMLARLKALAEYSQPA